MLSVSPASSPRGTIVILGGGDDDPLVSLLADLLPGPDAVIEILTTATQLRPARTASAYARAWCRLGYDHVNHLPVDEDHPADDPATLARLEAATLLFMSGGDQERITEFLLGTQFLTILKRRYQEDESFFIGGTSAGACVVGDPMLVQGQGWRSLMGNGIDLTQGLGLLPNLILDQHFAERSRYPRLLHAVLRNPTCFGVGLSEETGLIIRAGQFAEAFGDGVVATIDASQMTHTNVSEIGPKQMVSGHGVQLHLLVAGQQLDLVSREAT